jgi:hypothetical protein
MDWYFSSGMAHFSEMVLSAFLARSHTMVLVPFDGSLLRLGAIAKYGSLRDHGTLDPYWLALAVLMQSLPLARSFGPGTLAETGSLVIYGTLAITGSLQLAGTLPTYGSLKADGTRNGCGSLIV